MWRNRCLYIIMCVALGLFFILYNIRATLLIFGVIVLFPFVSYLLLRISRKQITAELILGTGTAHINTRNCAMIRIHNKGILPISKLEFDVIYDNSLIGTENVKHISLAFMGNMVQEVELFLSSEYVGNVRVMVREFELWDYSFCTRSRIRPDLEESILILPEEYWTDEALQTGSIRLFENESVLLNKPGADQTEILDIREYAQGDRVSRIHWKLSSKCDQLMIKEYASQLYYYPAILLDLRIGDKLEKIDLLEGSLTVFYNLGIWHIESNQPFEAVYYSKDSASLQRVSVTSREVFHAVVREIYNNITGDKQSHCLKEFYVSNKADRYSNIVYISGDMEGDLDYLRHLNAYLVLVVRGEADQSRFQGLEMELGYGNVDCINVYDCRNSYEFMASHFLKESRGE